MYESDEDSNASIDIVGEDKSKNGENIHSTRNVTGRKRKSSLKSMCDGTSPINLVQ
jgi:hypothetical protein